MTSIVAHQDHKQRVKLLVIIAVASIALWQTYIGSLVLYPFSILATWFHEMGHGISAVLIGSSFDRLVIYPDGSGVATIYRPTDGFRLGDAFVAASGPLGPAVAGSLLIMASRTNAATKAALTTLGAILLVSTLVWVRSLTGWLVLPAVGAIVLVMAMRGSPAQQRFFIQLLGVQACISVWRQFGYVFSEGGYVDGRLQLSDTGAIAQSLFLPYWVWGSVISIAIIAMLWASFKFSFRR